MKLNDLKDLLDKRLSKPFGVRAIMDGFRLMDEAGRSTSAYSDPLYIPFYYHLGREIQPATFLEFGFRLGLTSGSFLKSCKTVKKFLAFQQRNEEYYSVRLGKANVRDGYKGEIYVHVGEVTDEQYISKIEENKWSLAIINEETGYDKLMTYLDFAWINLEFDGFIVMDYISGCAKQVFDDFCRAKNRKPVFFETRYGVGILQR